MAMSFYNAFELPVTIVRPFNTYGPRQLMKHIRQGFVYWFMRQVLEGEEIQIFGTGEQLRDFTYIDDVVDAFLLAGASDKANGEVFNLGGERPYSLLEFTKILISECGGGSYKVVPFPEEKKRIDIGDFYADYSKITNTLGWRPKVTLKDGLGRTLDYYRKYMEHYLD